MGSIKVRMDSENTSGSSVHGIQGAWGDTEGRIEMGPDRNWGLILEMCDKKSPKDIKQISDFIRCVCNLILATGYQNELRGEGMRG